MTAIEVARTVTEQGCYLVRPRKDDPAQYDAKPYFTGSKRGWFALDSFSASAIVAVYEALNTTNRERFSKLSIPSMAKIAFKFVK